MEMRPLGRSGLKVPAWCLGTMTWGQQNTEAEGHAQMDAALDHGINFFDTAELYSIPPKADTQGSTERIIGTWLKARKNRDRIFLASKVVGRNDAFTWFRDPPTPSRLSKKQMREALDGSLKRLQTDYLDLYQIHSPERPMPWGSTPSRFSMKDYVPLADENPIEDQLEAMEEFVKAGKVRTIGLSNESAWGTMRFLGAHETRGLPRVVSVQNAYNLINRTYENSLAEIWLREGVGLLAYSPLAQGYLTGKYLDGKRPERARSTLFNRGQRYERPGCEEAIRDYLALAREIGVDPAVMSLAYVTSRPFVTSNIFGARTMAQLHTIFDAMSFTITPEIEARIDAIHQVRGNPAF